jgi:mRNA deadenylase 3'-5' endonuclease subunit Ccr4
MGLELDRDLSFNSHIDKLCNKLSQRIGVLKKIKTCLPKEQRLLYYNAMIKSVLNYGSVVWSNCDKEHLGRVLKMQKRAARVICDATKQTPSVKLFNSLQWLPFYEEVKIAKCSIAYKHIMHEVPIYIRDLLELNCQHHDRTTRYSNINLICPKFNRKTEGGRTFAVTTSQLWNTLNLELRKLGSLSVFKKKYLNSIFETQQLLSHFTV